MSDFSADTVTFPSLETLRARGTVKWTQYPEDVLPLWVAESDMSTCPAVLSALRDAIDREHLGYPNHRATFLQEATADWSAQRYGWRPSPENIFPLADVVRGVVLAIEHLTKPGSAIVVPTPAYMPFFEVGRVTGRETKFINTEYGSVDLAALEREFQAGAGAVILCNPNNPLGFTYDAEVLREITDLAYRYGARVISDEIHAPVVLEGTHTPTASVSEEAEAVTITVTATSKGWNTAGLKCAQFILNEDDAEVWRSLSFIVHEGASTLGQVAAAAAYRDGGPWLDNMLQVLRSNRDLLARRLPEVAPGARFTPPTASYLAWIDFTEVPAVDTDNPGKWLLSNAKVAVNPGTAFGPGGEGHVRLNFGTSPEILNAALDRIGAAMHGTA